MSIKNGPFSVIATRAAHVYIHKKSSSLSFSAQVNKNCGQKFFIVNDMIACLIIIFWPD